MFLRRMQSSRSFKRGKKSSSPGRETKDKTKRIKCFGCEHISFHFLLLVTNNSPILGGKCPDRHLCKNIPQVFSRGHDNQREHLAHPLEHSSNFLFPAMLAGEDALPLPASTELSWTKWGGQFHNPLRQCRPSISKTHIVHMSRR